MSHLPSLGALAQTGPAKLEAVTALVSKLTDDLKSRKLSTQERDTALEELKVYGRDPADAGPIFTREGVEMLTRHAFDSTVESTSRNALRCLCNTLLLKPETRQMFVDLDYEANACNKLKSNTWDDEFLVSRLIFLSTFDKNRDPSLLIDQHGIAATIVEKLARHAGQPATNAGEAKPDPMEGMALAETLKLLFSLTSRAPLHVGSFTPAIPHLVTLLGKHDVQPATAPLAPPLSLLINALASLKLDSELARSSLCPEDRPNSVSERLVRLLKLSMKAYRDTELELTATSLICIISGVHENAPEDVQKYLRSKLLPTEEDRKEVLGRGETLSSSLLRSITNPLTPELGKTVSHLFFEMSDRDASKFVNNVGYGFASGFLFQNNIPVPETAMKDADTEGLGGAGRAFNPITGQYLDSEKVVEMPEMTQEEKEREAERLFVLFERLKQTGIVNVQNPVEQAFREGRVQELDDDGDDDDDKKDD